MIAIALRGLAARKLRTSLTAVAIVLGVAMVSGTYFLTDTMREATESLTSDSYDGVDAVVTGPEPFEVDADESSGEPTPIQEDVLSRVREVPEVGAAVPEIMSGTRLIGRDGRPVDSQGAPNFGVGFDADEPGSATLTPFKLDAGRFPSAPGEIAIDAATADREGYRVGDTIGVSARGPVEQFEVVGVARFGSVRSIGGATVSLFTLEAAQRLFRQDDVVDSILLAGREGVSPPELRAALGDALPPSTRVTTAAEQDRFDLEALDQFVDITRAFLLAFGGIALLVGAFIIFNTLSITVAQRAREFALLRTIGASRRQVLTTVVVEAIAIGVLASLVGMIVGFGLAQGLGAVFTAAGVDLPTSGTVFALRTAVVSLVVGVLVTVLAGLGPAFRATRVAPVEALRAQLAPPSEPRLGWRRWLPGGAALAAGLVALAVAALDGELEVGRRLALMGAGCLLLFIGLAVISPALVRPLASLLGRPAARLAGAPGALARENSMRNPGRTAAVASALMIGLGLVTTVAVLQKGIARSSGAAVDDQVESDYVVASSNGLSPFAPEAVAAIEEAPEVDAVSSLRQSDGGFFGGTETVNGVDPGTFGEVYRFDWVEGSDAAFDRLDATGAVVTEDFAEDHDLAVGSSFEAISRSGRRLDLTVRGIHDPPALNPLALGPVTISDAGFDRAFEALRPRYAFVNLAGGATPASTALLDDAVRAFPDVSVDARAEFEAAQQASLDELAGLLYVLLGLSVLVALLGIVNALVLAVFERTREIGLLRAVGMTRRQARRMVRHESVITALLGTALGIGTGIVLAALATAALSELGVAFAVPVATLVGFGLVAILAGVLAAVLPARRAARVDVLDALQYE